MAIRTSCCFNLAPPSTTPSLPPPRTTQIPRNKVLEERPNTSSGTGSRIVIGGVSCMIIGLNLIGTPLPYGMAKEEETLLRPTSVRTEVVVDGWASKKTEPKWSDKRTCQPWRLNSLETIVPENLPRPSSAANRRWQAVRFSETAPPLKLLTSSNCFSM